MVASFLPVLGHVADGINLNCISNTESLPYGRNEDYIQTHLSTPFALRATVAIVLHDL